MKMCCFEESLGSNYFKFSFCEKCIYNLWPGPIRAWNRKLSSNLNNLRNIYTLSLSIKEELYKISMENPEKLSFGIEINVYKSFGKN